MTKQMVTNHFNPQESAANKLAALQNLMNSEKQNNKGIKNELLDHQ